MSRESAQRTQHLAALRRIWAVALIPTVTLMLVAGAAEMPWWGVGLVVGVQALFLWTAMQGTSDAAVVGDSPGIARITTREAVQAQLLPRAGINGAALALRLDGAERLRQHHGDSGFQQLTETLAARLADALRAQDLICTLDPDGFGVALFPYRGLDLGAVMAVAQRIQSQLAAPVTLNGVTVWPSVSIGFSLSPRAAQLNGIDMLQAAESAADKALRSGPGALSSYSVVDFPASLSGDRIATLRRALDSGEIRAHFQPQIRTDSGTISGLEALTRWHHPQKGVLSPADFLPQIEAAGLSPRLAEVMLRDALNTLAALDKAGLSVPCVSVNLSAHELRNPRLADEIAWELDRHDLKPERLALEILETVVTRHDDDIAVRTIARLSGMGCGIDLDDFGTGNASITAIRRFAVGRIKIDRSFVTNLHRDPDQQRMVAAILSMAAQLGLSTLAEGVEHPEEQVTLAQLGCDHLQGFSIARPMPAEELVDWIVAYDQALAKGEPGAAAADSAVEETVPPPARHSSAITTDAPALGTAAE